MPSPCNNLNVVPIKVSKLVRYQNLDANDFFLTVESGSSLISRRSTLADLKNGLNKLFKRNFKLQQQNRSDIWD